MLQAVGACVSRLPHSPPQVAPIGKSGSFGIVSVGLRIRSRSAYLTCGLALRACNVRCAETDGTPATRTFRSRTTRTCFAPRAASARAAALLEVPTRNFTSRRVDDELLPSADDPTQSVSANTTAIAASGLMRTEGIAAWSLIAHGRPFLVRLAGVFGSWSRR